ncbi:5091_t:CDS:2 [Ambispora leptoticha]|uniref:5091_t:CDS:1 n=1 Tax=Ambispora leptoticha TaxID=144679 RepID=A0A9N9B6P2_9GLOM|nr:5091_t:CDS:2 [Ambispora leptoticha]
MNNSCASVLNVAALQLLGIDMKKLEEWVVNEESGKNRGRCGADPSPLLKVDSTDKQVSEFKTMNTSEKNEIHEYKVEEESSKDMKTIAGSSGIKENPQPSYIPNFLPSLPDGCPPKGSEFESDIKNNAKKEKYLTQKKEKCTYNAPANVSNNNNSLKLSFNNLSLSQVHEKFEEAFNSFEQEKSPSVGSQSSNKKRNIKRELSYCPVNPEETICAFSSYGLFGDDTETYMPELSDSELFVLKPITSEFEVAAAPDETSRRILRDDRKIRISYSNNTLSRQNPSRISRRALPTLSDKLPPNLKTEKAENIMLTPKKKAPTIKTVKPKPTKNTSTSSTKTANEIAKQQLPPPLQDHNTESLNSEIINCICEFPDKDNGKLMISCDNCNVWFHGESEIN